jgi:hypothetical protein
MFRSRHLVHGPSGSGPSMHYQDSQPNVQTTKQGHDKATHTTLINLTWKAGALLASVPRLLPLGFSLEP